MKHFLQDILITLALGVGMAALCMPLLKMHAQQADNEHTEKRDYLESHLDDIAILITGHSQSESSMDPWIFDSVYNVSITARISYYDAALLARYVPRMPHLKAVIYPLICEYEPGTVFLKDDWRENNLYNYRFYWGIDEAPMLMERSNLFRHTYETVSRLLSIQSGRRTTDYDSLGFFSLGDNVSDGNNVYEAPGCEPMVTESLLKMAKVCNDHGVRLIVVTSPANSTYRASHTDCDSRMQKVIDHVAGKYPVEYHCYLNDEQFGDSLFSDQTHLNHRGATAFAQRIKLDFEL